MGYIFQIFGKVFFIINDPLLVLQGNVQDLVIKHRSSQHLLILPSVQGA